MQRLAASADGRGLPIQLDSKTKKTIRWMVFLFGVPEGIRTPDLLIRSQTLYPAELQAHLAVLLDSIDDYSVFCSKSQVFF